MSSPTVEPMLLLLIYLSKVMHAQGRKKVRVYGLCVYVETDRNPNFHYLLKPNILLFQNAEYSAETEYSAEYLIFC